MSSAGDNPAEPLAVTVLYDKSDTLQQVDVGERSFVNAPGDSAQTITDAILYALSLDTTQDRTAGADSSRATTSSSP